MKKTTSPLPSFTRFLKESPSDVKDSEYYETNKHLATDIGAKTMYENRFDFWRLVDKAPKALWGKKDDFGRSLDILWANEQIDIAFKLA